ncbi:MAG: competence/damage-inducible protein A [Isosphaeraceae bacterium]|nr:competence/damage-inducible protein A [Isosphaeraceae bacterium]
MKAEIIAIGSELVSGQRLDTNSPWLSRRLGELGIPVRFHSTLGDDLEESIAGFRIALARADLVVMTGGLGPTQDDLTREALAAVAGVDLVEDAAALEAIRALFARRHRVMTERNRVQALVPRGAEPLPNRVGTAPGIWMKVGHAIVACLPGVPHEMTIMFDEQVVPRLRAAGLTGRIITHRTIHLFGKGESEIEAEALDLTVRGRVPEVGITAHDATITFRVSAAGADEAEALALIEPTLRLIRERFGPLVIGEQGEDVGEALVRELVRTNTTLATAESCTGGLVAHRITTVAGVSPYYPGGVVSYSPEAKTILLGIPADLIAQYGVVSAPIAEAMAAGVRRRLGADIGLGITGIAGPTGGTAETPVGTVYLGLATAEGTQSRRLDLGPEQPREVIQSRAAKSAMNWVRLHLLSGEWRGGEGQRNPQRMSGTHSG